MPATPSSGGAELPPSEFTQRVRELLQAAEASVPRTCVLVWGPARDETNQWWLKRLQIRDHLIGLGYDAAFSEDLPMSADTNGDARRLAARTAELAHAQAADYIVVLMSSYGSVAEFHDFGSMPTLARKMLVIMDREHVEGYAASLLPQFEGNNGRVHLAEIPKDLIECNVLGVAVDSVEKVRQAKMFDALEGGSNA